VLTPITTGTSGLPVSCSIHRVRLHVEKLASLAPAQEDNGVRNVDDCYGTTRVLIRSSAADKVESLDGKARTCPTTSS
jgi:hypothetical protein